MQVRYRCSEDLPRGIAAVLIPGDGETVIQISAHARPCDIAEALDEIVGQSWVPSAWLHVGDLDGSLRSVS